MTMSQETEDALKDADQVAAELKVSLQRLYQQTGYEDLEHAVLGLDIVRHAIDETLEGKGLGGQIARTPNSEYHDKAEGWLAKVRELQVEAQAFLSSHPNEDLETALKALEIAEGSLHEVAEHYE